MTIKPSYSPLAIDGNDVLAESVRFSVDVLFFERVEFSNERLRNAPDPDGKRPVIIEMPGGRITQINDGCTTPALRPLGTDDDNLDNMFRRFDIRRWEITGEPSDPNEVQAIYDLHKLHKVLLNRFEARQQATRANVSYDYLIAAQAETFTYLTATGKSMTGFALGEGLNTTINNILITNFTPDVDYEEPLDAAYTTSRVLRRWSAVIETRVEVAASSPIF